MHRVRVFLFSTALAAMATSSCVAGDLADSYPSNSCTPGRQTSCPCGGAVEGVQVCRDDGSGWAACVCNDAAVADVTTDTGPLDVSPDSFSPDTATPPADSSVDTTPTVDTTPVDTATGPTWVWLDRGGPAFQPHACPDGPGVTGGNLTNPEAFFAALIKGRAAKDWVTVMNEIEKSLWACGVGQQRGSGGDVRGRLFLPTAACPDASPPAGDALAIKLGVRQLPECWTHAVDVVDG